MSSAAPNRLLCVKVDTLGDVVLFAPTLRAIRTAWPTTRITVVIRQAYADLAPWLADDVQWLTTTLDPFARGPSDDPEELTRLRAAVAEIRPDVIVAATSRHNWLETVLAASPGATRRLTLGSSVEDEFFATQLRVRLGVDAATAFTEQVAVDVAEPDWRRSFRLADALLKREVPRTPPQLAVDEKSRANVADFLARQSLQPGQYVVCAAAGFANVALKTWPADRFAETLRHVREQHGWPTLLIGHESEREYLEPLANAAGNGTALWLGREGSLPSMLALLAGARLFVGNDTGAMHLAAALDVPVVAVFGGGTWPRFVPAARHHVTVVQPLPCFGCGWDCAFGDAPCIREIRVGDVTSAIDRLLLHAGQDFAEVAAVEHLSVATRDIMGRAAARYRQARADHLARQRKLEEITELDREKDAAIQEKEVAIDAKEAAILEAEAVMRVKEASIFEKENEIHAKDREIAALKVVCDEREKLIIELDRNAKAAMTQATTVAADKALLEKSLAELPADRAEAVKTNAEQATHVRNLWAMLTMRDAEITQLKASVANLTAGHHDLEQAKRYGQLLTEKELVIRELHRSCQEREAVIRQLTAEITPPTGWAWKLWMATCAFWREKISRPVGRWLFDVIAEDCWMQIGELRQYPPRPLRWDTRLPRASTPASNAPQLGIVTPSYGQAKFIERTMRSVLDQSYPHLRYVVQDGGSKDGSTDIISRYAGQLHHWESVKDAGQADAVARGFAHMTGTLRSHDIMAWLNSDDLLAPGVLAYVAQYFAQHPEVDVLYGHRIIIDDDDREIGRWIMPRHPHANLEWVDYIPQETLFWRKKAWDLVGGIDPTFQFALDWDLLARFQQAGCRMVRVPYFLGAFRVHAEQKTSQALHTTGADEMRRIRTRFHSAQQDNNDQIEQSVRQIRFWGALTARLHDLGIRW